MTRRMYTAKFIVCVALALLIMTGCGGGDAVSSEQGPEKPSQESVPVSPANMMALTLSGDRIRLTWDDNADNEIEYRSFGALDLSAGYTYSL